VLEHYHHTGKPGVFKFDPEKESFEDFLDKYDLELDRIKKELGGIKNEHIGLEIPEGLRKFSNDLVNYLENHLLKKIIITADTCFGACDIKYYQFETLGINKIIHFGNERIPNRVYPKNFQIVFIPLYWKPDITQQIPDAIRYLKKKKFRKVGLVSSIQFIKNIDLIKKSFESAGIEVYVGTGTKRILFKGQVLGCNPSAAASVADKVDIFVMFESGGFHALPIVLTTKKDVLCFDTFEHSVNIYSYKELRKKYVAELMDLKNKLKNIRKVAFLVSNKLGQSRPQSTNTLRKKFEKKGYQTSIVISDYLNPNNINAADYDLLVATMCPRIALDERNQYIIPIISVMEAFTFIDDLKEFGKDLIFDQIV
jgi:2-(3-amino-3-carboxypropyl)histidine synthase